MSDTFGAALTHLSGHYGLALSKLITSLLCPFLLVPTHQLEDKLLTLCPTKASHWQGPLWQDNQCFSLHHNPQLTHFFLKAGRTKSPKHLKEKNWWLVEMCDVWTLKIFYKMETTCSVQNEHHVVWNKNVLIIIFGLSKDKLSYGAQS